MNDEEECDKLITDITNAGYFAKYRESIERYPASVICATHEPKRGSSALSFWATRIGDTWYLASWGYRYWRVSSGYSISDVCIAYLKDGTSLGAPPSSVLNAFELAEIDLDKFKRLNDDDQEEKTGLGPVDK